MLKKKQKNRAVNLTLNIIYIIIVAIIVIILINTIFSSISSTYKENKDLIVNYDLATDIIPDPVQKSVSQEFINLDVRGVTLNIKKLASYDITGKVEAIKYYSTNPLANLFVADADNIFDYASPIDISLSWGKIAQSDNSKHFYASQYTLNTRRVVYYSYDNYLAEEYGSEYVQSHFSNNHIVTLDSGFRKVLSKIKVGDIVRMKGYLVYITYMDKNGNYGTWGPSSLTRTDTGVHACEIIYLEDIVIMP